MYETKWREKCIISAYWHDVGRCICDKGHEQESGRILKDEMSKLGYRDMRLYAKDYIDEIEKMG